jgi:hypothetical protein
MNHLLILFAFLLSFAADAQTTGTYGRYPAASGGSGNGITTVTGTSPMVVTQPTTSSAVIAISTPIAAAYGGTGKNSTATFPSSGTILTSTSGLTGLTGDVTATSAGVTVVALVGGQTATQVSAAAVSVQAATSSAVASTLVERDGSAGVTGLSLNVANNGNTISLLSDGSSTVALTLPNTQGTNGQLLTSGASGAMTWSAAGVTTNTLNTTLQQLAAKRYVDNFCFTNITLNGSQTCDGVTVGTSDVVGVMGQSTATQDGIYLENDFGAWTRVANVSGLLDLQGSTICSDAYGGGTNYQNTCWFYTGDGASTATWSELPIIASPASGGIPYFSSATKAASSGVLAANKVVVGGGAGSAPSTVTAVPVAAGGTNSATALNNGRIMVSSGSAVVEDAFAFASGAAVGFNAPASPASATVTIAGIANMGALQIQPNTGNNQLGVVVTGANDDDAGIQLYNTANTGHKWDFRSDHGGNFEFINETLGASVMVISQAGELGLNQAAPAAVVDINTLDATTALGLRVSAGGHIRSTGTAPTAAPSVNAGTGASCAMTHATDIAGTLTLTTTAVSPGAGAECTVTFHNAYITAPVCVWWPAGSGAATQLVLSGVYMTTTTSQAAVNFTNSDVSGHTYVYNYHCLETL